MLLRSADVHNVGLGNFRSVERVEAYLDVFWFVFNPTAVQVRDLRCKFTRNLKVAPRLSIGDLLGVEREFAWMEIICVTSLC